MPAETIGAVPPEIKSRQSRLHTAREAVSFTAGLIVDATADYPLIRTLHRKPDGAPLVFSPIESWRREGKSLLDYHRLDSDDSLKLEGYVDKLETWASDKFITQEEFDRAEAEPLDMKLLEEDLEAHNMTMEQFKGAVTLAMLTECATESYSPKFVNSGERHDAPWLGRFTDKIWVPDELKHAEPFRILAIKLGIPAEELDRQIKIAQAANYNYGDEHGPSAITTFGWLQEYLTDHYHGLIAKMVKRAAPETSRLISRVKQRETLHTEWYRDMTAMQVGMNTDLIIPVVASLKDFHLPGNEIAPDLQDRAEEFLKGMGADYERVRRDIVRLVYESTKTPQNAGKLVVEMAVQSGEKLGPLDPVSIQQGLGKNAGIGAGIETLLGEALMESVGLKGPVQAPDKGVSGRIRRLVRTKASKVISGKLDSIFAVAA